MTFVIIQDDNGMGKDTLARKLAESGYGCNGG